MARTPEGRVKDIVNSALKNAGAYKHCPVGNGLGAPALDYHVGHNGFYAGIETKALGKRPTDRQVQTMIEIRDAGGSLFMIDGPDSMDFAALQGWLKHPAAGCIAPMARIMIDNYEIKLQQQKEKQSDDRIDDRLGDIEHIHRSIGGGD
jgi:hypothetical protein